MNAQGGPSPYRLDSWKAIADYLGRDVATVRRWERLHQLPVRRIAGRGRSVFAYASEVDEWLRARPPADVTADEDTPVAVRRPPRRWAWAAAVVLLGPALFWSIPILTSESLPFRAEFTSTGIVALDTSGRERWRYPFSPEDQMPEPTYAAIRILGGTDPGVLAATSYYERKIDGNMRGGQLLWFSTKGALSRTFSFHDRVVVGGEIYGTPWAISDFSVDESGGRRRVAVSALHQRWWPSLVTVLDEQWRRTGTFVNQGWVNQVHWLSPESLLVSGFSNDHDGGMVGILDSGALEGQSPVSADPAYRCTTCGQNLPLKYAVLSRSEVNQASGSPLNGAIVQMQDGRILVRTIEMPRVAQAVEALYEFSPSLELLRASYGDRYWEAHRALEAEGKIGHTRERCPYRAGPQGIRVWEPATGWRAIASERPGPQ